MGTDPAACRTVTPCGAWACGGSNRRRRRIERGDTIYSADRTLRKRKNRTALVQVRPGDTSPPAETLRSRSDAQAQRHRRRCRTRCPPAPNWQPPGKRLPRPRPPPPQGAGSVTRFPRREPFRSTGWAGSRSRFTVANGAPPGPRHRGSPAGLHGRQRRTARHQGVSPANPPRDRHRGGLRASLTTQEPSPCSASNAN